MRWEEANLQLDFCRSVPSLYLQPGGPHCSPGKVLFGGQVFAGARVSGGRAQPESAGAVRRRFRAFWSLCVDVLLVLQEARSCRCDGGGAPSLVATGRLPRRRHDMAWSVEEKTRGQLVATQGFTEMFLERTVALSGCVKR